MASKNEAKIKFTAETGEFNDAIKRANSQMSVLRAELKLSDTQLKANGASVEGLANKQKILHAQLEASEDKTNALNQKVQKAIEIYGEDAIEVSKLRTQLLNAQTAQERIKQSIDACNAEMEQQKSAASGAGDAMETMSDKVRRQETELASLKREYANIVSESGDAGNSAQRLAMEISSLSSDLKRNKEALSSAADKADEFDNSIEASADSASGAGDGFTILKGTIADLASSAIQAAIGKVSELVGYLAELPSATMELRQDLSTLTTSFDTMGFSTNEAKNTWKELYAVFGEDDRAVETANNISKMANNQKELNSWVTITTGIWGSYQDSLPVESLAEASNETAKTGKVTGVLADALNWSSDAADKFAKYMSDDVVTAEDAFNVALSECTTEQERQKLITETLTDLYGGAADTYRDTAGAQMEAKEATAANMQAEADLAATIEPVTTEFTNLKTELLEGATPAIEKMSEKMTDAMKWMKEHPTTVKVISAAVGTLAIGFGTLAVALGVYSLAQWAANLAIAPFALTAAIVVVAVALIVGACVALALNWDKIKNKAEELKKDVSKKFTELKNNVSNKIEEMKQKAQTKFNELKTGAVKKFEELKTGASNKVNSMKTTVNNKFNELKTGAVNKVSSLKTSVITKFNELKTGATSKVSSMKTTVVNKFSEMKTGASSKLSSLKTSALNKFSDIKNGISTRMENARSAVSRSITRIKGLFNFSWSLPKIKVPHFSISGSFSLKNKTVPHVSVEWYKNGGIMTNPTVFGMNGNNLMAGGEAGPEAILPISLLQDFINRAFERNIVTYATEGAGSDVYNFYLDNATVNSSKEMESVAKRFIEELVRLGGMNR